MLYEFDLSLYVGRPQLSPGMGAGVEATLKKWHKKHKSNGEKYGLIYIWIMN